MTTVADDIEGSVDEALQVHNTGAIQYYAYKSGTLDIYGQREKTYDPAVQLVGRAIRRPTNESVTVIGDGESFDLACVFSRTEMRKKFPTLDEGAWVDVKGDIEWMGYRYRIEQARPSGQVQSTFILMILLCKSFPGDPG